MLGAALRSVGHRVNHLPSPRNPDGPLPILLALRDRRKTAHTVCRGAYPYDLVTEEQIPEFPWVIAPVGHQHLRAVVNRLTPHLKEGQVVLWMGNVWDDYDWLVEQLGAHLVFGFTHFGGNFVKGRLRGWLLPNISLAEGGVPDPERLEEIKRIWVRAGFRPKMREDMRGWLWTHFAWMGGVMGTALEAGGYRKLRWRWGQMKKAFKVVRLGMKEAEAMGAEVRNFKEGRRAYQPLWWNALKMRVVFMLPGIAAMVDRGMDREKWGGYVKTMWGKYPSDQELRM